MLGTGLGVSSGLLLAQATADRNVPETSESAVLVTR